MNRIEKEAVAQAAVRLIVDGIRLRPELIEDLKKRAAVEAAFERESSLREARLKKMLKASRLGLIAALAASGAAWFSLYMRQMMRQVKEGATKSNLSSLRSSLVVYYADLEGQYPADLAALTINGKYLPQIPPANPSPYHPASAASLLGSAPDDSGGWLYDNATKDANWGSVWVNCTHTDTKGSAWSSY